MYACTAQPVLSKCIELHCDIILYTSVLMSITSLMLTVSFPIGLNSYMFMQYPLDNTCVLHVGCHILHVYICVQCMVIAHGVHVYCIILLLWYSLCVCVCMKLK